MTNEQLIAQAAEAIIIKQGDSVIKRRVKKGYRIEELDEKLRKLRTRSEAKILEKARKIINVPKVLKVNEKTKEIEMEFIEGKKLSEYLDNLKNKFEVMKQVGKEVAKLHDADIIHGDLTTSNMILVENKENKTKINPNKPLNKSIKKSQKELELTNNNFQVYLIDFGLGFISKRLEDKAVDLHLIKQALEAKHWKDWEKLYKSFEKGYKTSKESNKVLEQLKKVEARGRYRKNAQ